MNQPPTRWKFNSTLICCYEGCLLSLHISSGNGLSSETNINPDCRSVYFLMVYALGEKLLVG